MNLGMDGKVAAVTGGSKGIGLAVVQALVAEGVRVAVGAREESPALKALASDGSVLTVPGDLSTGPGAERLVQRVLETFGALDILVNNVGGVRPRPTGFLDVSDDDFRWAFELDFLSAVRMTRAALPHLLARAPSSIVTVASVNATLPDPTVIDYGAAKAALVNFSKALSKEVGPRGVRVNTVSPGPVATDLWLGADGVAETLAASTGLDPTAVAAQAVSGSATGRFTRPEEVAHLVVVLAGPRAGNVTGTDVIIDGGLVTSM
ncbi:SDR family NAD(P)-dependent oxidoreductase [Nakamurella endophytica]|uniref:3-oxoacyl-ACP reductase n=1 Tax=Nakamurella endophytica TaxID=1748367 RepID=A0A917SN73_9ACTN|nr:oxidoreductase [Nakamurella endophytica]GGL87609.1 3-oxoacyl-ACP reductase [Nakamurella endophytica]